MAPNNRENSTSHESNKSENSMMNKSTRRKFLATTTGVGLGIFSLGLSESTTSNALSSSNPIKSYWSTDRVSSATGYGGAAASLDPLGTQAAIDTLERGGNAIDAAVAASAMLGVVQPFTTGIGGDSEMTIYLAEEDEVVTINGRSTAPKDFDPERFQDLPLSERFTGPLTTGVPGLVRGWETMLREYGTISLSQLLQPAINKAQAGFEVDQSYAGRIESSLEDFRCFTSSKNQFLTVDNEVPAVGEHVRNRELAQTYRKVAHDGVESFYEGEIAQAIVDTVADPPVAPGCETRPGKLNLEDLIAYDAPIHDPVTISYRDYDIAGIGLPSTGGPTVGEVLQIIEDFEMNKSREQALHYLLEALRIAFTDRAKYIGTPWDWDPSVPLSEYPVEQLISGEYAAARRELIGATAVQEPYSPGNPCNHSGLTADPYPPGDACKDSSRKSLESPVLNGNIHMDSITNENSPKLSTTHLSVSDSAGNIVSNTSSIISIGGSAVTVPGYGFLLNNVLIGAVPPAAPGDRGGRPYSNGSPTIVFDNGDPILTVGSPGSFSIITTVLNVLVNYLDLGMDLRNAIAAPRVENTSASLGSSVESDLIGSPVADALEGRGHELEDGGIIGEPTGIAFLPNGQVQAVAEPVSPREDSALVEKEAQNETAFYQVDFVAGDPIEHLRGPRGTYSNDQLIRFAHGSSEKPIIRRSEGEFTTDTTLAERVESQDITVKNGKATITFTVSGDSELLTLSLVSYRKPGPVWSPETEHLQGFIDAETNTFDPGTYTLSVDLPNEIDLFDKEADSTNRNSD